MSRKITDAVAQIKLEKRDRLKLGRLDAVRDWGYAGDYVRAMWLMLQQQEPKDYVIATGIPHTVQDLVEAAFGALNLDWKRYVEVDPKYVRPPEEHILLGDPARAQHELCWDRDVEFPELIEMMVSADLARHRS